LHRQRSSPGLPGLPLFTATTQPGKAATELRGSRHLARRSPADRVREAHRRAAAFWRWRVREVPQSREQDVEQLLEARYHHREAGETDEAVEVTEVVCSQLDTWGAYRREEQLCREVLTWVPERSRNAAAFLHQLGIVAQKRGAYDDALEWYQKSLEILEELGDRSGMAGSYHQLGRVAQERPDGRESLKRLSPSLDAGDRQGLLRDDERRSPGVPRGSRAWRGRRQGRS
jgi:tetratricopeptide (TPR) repeat protein